MSHEAVKPSGEVMSKNGMGFFGEQKYFDYTLNKNMDPLKDCCWWQTVKSEARLCSVKEY